MKKSLQPPPASDNYAGKPRYRDLDPRQPTTTPTTVTDKAAPTCRDLADSLSAGYMWGPRKTAPPHPQRLCQLPTDRQEFAGFGEKLSKAVSRFASPTG